MLCIMTKHYIPEIILCKIFDKYVYYRSHKFKLELVNKKLKSHVNNIRFKPNSFAS